jgi:cell division septum initiation protein DivIVA
VDVHAKLAEVRRAVEQARSMPMSASAVVNRAELLQQLDELQEALSGAFTDADEVLADREAVLEAARKDAEQIIKDAHDERERIVSDTEVFRVAKRQADEVAIEAQTEASELRKETDEYVDAKLANFENALESTLESVKRGRGRLAGRSAFEGITEDEADRIQLPEHLDG